MCIYSNRFDLWSLGIEFYCLDIKLITRRKYLLMYKKIRNSIKQRNQTIVFLFMYNSLCKMYENKENSYFFNFINIPFLTCFLSIGFRPACTIGNNLAVRLKPKVHRFLNSIIKQKKTNCSPNYFDQKVYPDYQLVI